LNLSFSGWNVLIGGVTRLKFWGVRGSIPTPGPGTVRYGGNTSCLEVRHGDDIIILDAGTGLRALGSALLAEFKNQPLNLTLLVTHTHWDHIQGLPFFAPIYNPRCRLRILGAAGTRESLISALTGQMESTYFPENSNRFFAVVDRHRAAEQVDDADVREFQARIFSATASCAG
jgi:phosphoribosyl 1,2-cyclic phosphodiesterase